MQKILLLFLLTCICSSVTAQHTLSFTVKDKHTNEVLSAATVQLAQRSTVTDSSGKVSFTNLQQGVYKATISHVGYSTQSITITVPLANNEAVVVLLEREEEEEEEIIITSTRSTRTFQNIPTRVEFIAGEELDEKANMKPGDIRMLLNESTGIQTQQTSATSANASIRIQGLDGRYTQILKDGFPLYNGAAGGLGLLQIAPLDLKQVEVIKGSASTLYGGGAIAGLVNLISKTPTAERDFKIHLNGTTAGGIDANLFYGKRINKFGLTVFTSRNSNAAYDPAKINLSAIPAFQRYTVNPRLFYYPSAKTKLILGINTVVENRLGGNMEYIKENTTAGYYERNKSQRYAAQFSLDHDFGEASRFTLKQSVSYFNRKLSTPGYVFEGKQLNSFTEANYSHHGETAEWVAGVNMWNEHFNEVPHSNTAVRSFKQNTVGAFVQNTFKVNEWLHFESGVRGDYVNNYGFAFLPRVAVLFKPSASFSSRIGGGMGYKPPTIFTEESERLQYSQVLGIDASNKLERSYGFNADVNYKTKLFDAVSFSINQLFFYTRINQPLLLQSTPNGRKFVNSSGHIDTRGIETNIKIGYEDFKLFLGYTFTDTKIHEGINKRVNPLTARNRINAVLMYEAEEKWKAGLEAYYFDKQLLTDGQTGKAYWICGFMVERLWEKFSLYINFENFLDARQTRFDSIYTGNINNPVFRDVYAPLDGFVVNGGLKIKL
ncbi:iron complex outermembrane receptor protein [Lacibacter cauensis]|uniref:Iron complex outermembrane receptor protein n=1 Tax=Lacibacter cauensis TaxID=510947 RepID=A0A562SQ55_9BACT|nr:TonB-dependent receptor [Lacibacter cauensis]TWI83362.1 iron complex outermembrane receptor protein [Lacibacter cauensis]